ncbi:MAG: OmpA family protein [Sterolibacteriaceae bacterium]|uniref:OmpA family protein n=1 Tax=Candidatus Methylophosphatis roskildensis TaxID=2899263 RepID=A0A9D7DYA0_9PROT|nr:OmpA family protein [Candidatus Methylophosphatis roskildensis]MBK7237560.1 OmpA family protein [Sterolibacteriaceae bacterium]
MELFTICRSKSAKRVLVAWEQAAAQLIHEHPKRMVVIVETDEQRPQYLVFDDLYKGLSGDELTRHASRLRSLLRCLANAGIPVNVVAAPVPPTRTVDCSSATKYLLRQPIVAEASNDTPLQKVRIGASVMVGAYLLAACSIPRTPEVTASSIPIAPTSSPPILQVQQNRSHRWELVPCIDGACAHPTPKTLAHENDNRPLVGLDQEAVAIPVALAEAAKPLAVDVVATRGGATAREAPVALAPIRSVFFATGKSELDPVQLAAITALASTLKKASRIVIAGCTDKTGKHVTNQRLAQRRADALRNALFALGVDKQKIVLRVDLSGDGQVPGIGATGEVPDDANARSRRGDIEIA